MKALRIAIRLKNERAIKKARDQFADLCIANPNIELEELVQESGVTAKELGVDL